MSKFSDWLVTIGSAISQLLYVIFTYGDNSNLSISGEAYYHRNRGLLAKLWYKLINCIFFWQKDHCKWAYYNDLNYARWYIYRHEDSRGK